MRQLCCTLTEPKATAGPEDAEGAPSKGGSEGGQAAGQGTDPGVEGKLGGHAEQRVRGVGSSGLHG